MGAPLAGLLFLVIGILLWVGVLSLSHAFAAFLIILGVALVLFGFVPAVYRRRA
jgi:hypothetical protein